ncbi:crossover junction endodeoxyribonuclease [Aspergillus stella-maris]|uniref:crossover junction endodeoxyribonuclease n=1 Tax=Aspergillus stella-maris TaxID=1810926 RepID=UPI003CCD7B1D
MGIPGLINALGPGERISLSKLAITHLERTSRPICIAVDISIWLFQVQAGRGGKNPELRTLFYRLLKILALPIHPLFVYDGRHKPPFKRGKAVSARSYGSAPIIQLSKILVDLFKFPRHEAPGEAEAECSRLQMAGVVDAVMSNDVDALMFGSRHTVMNFSKEAGSGAGGATHVTSYTMRGDDSSNVKLDRSGMILFAMLSGGDYLPSGVPKCGSKLAAEIAKAGFGGDLLEVLEADGAELDARLNEWRERLQYELEENESGYFQTKHKVVRIPETFPDRTILSYYAKPVVSTDEEIEFLKNRLRNAWDRDVDVWQLRQFAAEAFEWNYRSGARKVIRLLAEPLVSYRLRLGQHPMIFGGPRLSNVDAPAFQKVYKSRSSFSTDGMTELQYDMVPVDVVGLDLMAEEPNPPLPSQEAATAEEEDDGDGDGDGEAEVVPQSPTKKRVTKRYDPYASEKVWVFETLALMGIPNTVTKWKQEQLAKQAAASVPKKTTTRKAGPRRRKELDPSMKQGSILKYGTLKKGRSDISEYKSSQLFDAAVSKESPTTSPPFSSPAMYGLGMSTPPKLSPRADGFDYLVDRFTSCDLSGSPVKRRPVTRSLRSRAAVTSSGAEIIDLAEEDDSPPPTPRIRMSYSSASYTETRCHNYFSRPCSPNPTQVKATEEKISLGVEQLEQAISSLQLEIHDTVKASPRKNSSKAKPKKSKGTQPEIATKDGTPRQYDLEVPEPPKPTRRRDTAKEKNSKASAKETSQNETSGETVRTAELPTHLESITVRDGFWTVDTNASNEKTVVQTTDSERASKDTKKKRIPRVSILDLTFD